MKHFEGTDTKENLWTAFAAEANARARYLFFAARARAEGYEHIAAYFEETAGNEQEHARIWLKLIMGAAQDNEALMATLRAVSGDKVMRARSTAENLRNAISSESYESVDMYPKFARTAAGEGFGPLVTLFGQVADIEKTHAAQFRRLLESLGSPGALRPSSPPDSWKCCDCGGIVNSAVPPVSCLVCAGLNFRQLSW